jgi:hypothetical protein
MKPSMRREVNPLPKKASPGEIKTETKDRAKKCLEITKKSHRETCGYCSESMVILMMGGEKETESQ